MISREQLTWKKVLEDPMPLNVMLNTLPTKGNLVYEYNPFRNYRLTKNRYWYKEAYYSLSDLKKLYDIAPYYKTEKEEEVEWVEGTEAQPTIWKIKGTLMTEEVPELYEAGQLVDFITDEFKFSLEHPVHIVPQYSYDGSVNLIINDGLNKPRLINSRFSATGRNTYEIIDRKGNNDTNIYDQGEQFDIDTSLYKIVDKIPKVNFIGTSAGGNLKIGNYHFYFKLADSDGNETDFIAESGLVSIFIGDGAYNCVYTGTKNENSGKQVEFSIYNVDASYDYIMVYYSRYTAEAGDNYVTEYVKINKKFHKDASKIVITGFEESENISATDINLNYNLVDAAKTSAVCQNMLFMGNVKKPDIPYNELQDLSLRILPFAGRESYDPEINEEYVSQNHENSYINVNYIYNKTGYWPEELYRFGIVYILPNGQLTPVFDIRGAFEIDDTKAFTNIDITKEVNGEKVRQYIKYNEKTFYINETGRDGCRIKENSVETIKNPTIFSYENVKGVCSFKFTNPSNENPDIYYVRFHMSKDLKEKLREYVKGYFFVRQTRIPLILSQGITIGIDKESGTPTIPTAGGILERLSETLEKTHVETENINGLNYISEGFLKRYTFTFKKKSSSLWKEIGTIAAITAAVVAAAAVTIVTAGGGAVIAGAAAVAAGAVGVHAGALVVGSVIVTNIISTVVLSAAGAAVAAGVTATLASTQELKQAVARIGEKKVLNGKATVAPDGYKIEETEDSRTLVEDFEERIIIKDSTKNNVQGIICPDYTVNQAYYNQIFTGGEHYITTDYRQSSVLEEFSKNTYFTNNNRHFYIENYGHYTSNIIRNSVNIIGVPDNVVCIGLKDVLYRSRAGEAEEAWRYRTIGESNNIDTEAQKINSDIVRGSFGPYLAFNNTSIGPAQIVNIYIPGYNTANIPEYINIRMHDNSTYYAISDRIDINDYETLVIGNMADNESLTDVYRGDCYLCQYTQRINRNFNDPSAPYNDDIVDKNTWRDSYDPDDSEKYAEINLGDINAIPLGMWVTFQLRSSNNLNIRTLDGSNVDETAMSGHPRGYFPVHPMSVDGIFKKQESQIYNKGFTKSVNDRWNFGLPDVPYIKNWFGTRIMYSDVHVNDGFKNGFRIFQGTHYRDYTREYGEIVKLVPFESSLLCVFEHGIALIPVNERTIAGQGAGGNVYINTSNVLPENPKIISDMFGSQWPESILKVPGRTGDAPQYVYGVDTVAKKIWRTDGNTLQCISDFKVQEFLNNNITLGERELTPKIGIRNVKTHYNAFKRDVMFTFYDNTYGFEEKVWNLCWNELLQKFITFYSWVPSYMENINNIPFSFNRDVSKWIAKLGTSHTENSFADGITLSNVVINIDNNNFSVNNYTYNLKYLTNSGETKDKLIYVPDDKKVNFIGILSLSNRVLPQGNFFYQIEYNLEQDSFQNYKNFKIEQVTKVTLPEDAKFRGKEVVLYGLYFYNTGEVKYKDDQGSLQNVRVKSSTGSYGNVKGTINNLCSELYYRNIAGNAYSDYDNNKIGGDGNIYYDKPIFKDITGKRPMLPRKQQINPDKIVTMLNVNAKITVFDDSDSSLSDTYYNIKAGYQAGQYKSVVSVISKWNLQFLTTDFWKHGQAGIIDIADDIYPTSWYGKQHPFEFEVIVVNDPSVHKIFSNLELVANKAKPESFHYEIIGESYDFAKDKPNMYFRQEAKKALWQYNGSDITYNRNFLKIQPRQQAKSADLPHKYYYRQNTINEIEDCYDTITLPDNSGYSYKHLSGAEIVYYPNRQEYRIWQHTPAIDMDDTSYKVSYSNSGCRGLIEGNMRYLEDRWKVTINPILICYKNEGKTWQGKSSWTSQNRPPLTIKNSPIPDDALETIDENNQEIVIPDELWDLGYTYEDMDTSNWLNDISIYGTNFGEAQNRKELDLKDKFMKVRIRYSGEELAVIDFLNTIYRVSYA